MTHKEYNANKDRDYRSERILYDARGVRVKQSRFPKKLLNFFLFWLLPWAVINGIIFVLVTAKPEIGLRVSDTNDYRTCEVEMTVKSLLPIKEMEASINSEPLELTHSGKTWKGTVTKNGSIVALVTSVNGMRSQQYADVSILDDELPSIDEESCSFDSATDLVSFTLSDSQSGIDFDSVYGETPDGRTVRPESYNKETGLVVMPIRDADAIEIHFSDMAGNTRTASFSVTTVVVENEDGHIRVD